MSGESHADQTNNHAPFADVYADEAARVAATGFSRGVAEAVVPFDASDVGKFVWQSSDDSIWMLTAITPAWLNIAGAPTRRTVTGTDNMLATDVLVFLDPTAAAFIFSLVAIASWRLPCTFINIADPDSSSNVVTLDADGAHTFGASALTIDLAPGDRITLFPSTATRLEIIG